MTQLRFLGFLLPLATMLASCANGYSTSYAYWPGHIRGKVNVYHGCVRSDRCFDPVAVAQVLSKGANRQTSAPQAATNRSHKTSVHPRADR
jgi:hypothetical protein